MALLKPLSALATVSAALGVPPDWLDKLIDFESGWNPAAKNPVSSARGLVQFIDSTARSLGYTDSAALVKAHPDAESQLSGPVYQYLKKYAPFPTEQSLYMAVFYPAARFVSAQSVFPDSVRAVNPGINTPADYVSKVNKKKVINDTFLIAGIILLITGTIYFIRKEQL